MTRSDLVMNSIALPRRGRYHGPIIELQPIDAGRFQARFADGSTDRIEAGLVLVEAVKA